MQAIKNLHDNQNAAFLFDSMYIFYVWVAGIVETVSAALESATQNSRNTFQSSDTINGWCYFLVCSRVTYPLCNPCVCNLCHLCNLCVWGNFAIQTHKTLNTHMQFTCNENHFVLCRMSSSLLYLI